MPGVSDAQCGELRQDAADCVWNGAASNRGQRDWYLTAVTVFKNEAPYLDEWLAFCMLQRIERILLYDNCSTDNSREVLQPWIEAGIVELIDWPLHWKARAQTRAFVDALHRLRGRAKWIAYIDIDEFLFSPTGQTVAQVLKQYEGHAGVIVNWQCYGSSGHKARPSGLTIESYTRRAKSDWARNRRVKTIVDPEFAVEPQSAHLFKVQPGHALVTDDFKAVRVVRSINGRRKLRHLAAWLPYLPFDPYSKTEPSIRQVSVSNLRINHYVTRSDEEMPLKYKDRDSMTARDRRSHARYHDRNEVEDPILASEATHVREIIAAVRAGVWRSLDSCR
jgi:Glycosyltransferase family 92